MSAGPPVLLLALAVLLWPSRRALVAVRARSSAIRPAPALDGPSGAGIVGAARAVRRRQLLAGAAGVAAGLLVGGFPGLLVAVGVAAGADRLLRSSSRGDVSRGSALGGDLPVACELLAVCLEAGLPVGGALAAVAEVVPGPLRAELATAAGLTRWGAAPRQAWAAAPPELAALGRVLVRAGESGSAAVPALRALAADARVTERSRVEASVHRAGVWVLAPLGACFLPAFVCLGVAPVVLGIAADVFG